MPLVNTMVFFAVVCAQVMAFSIATRTSPQPSWGPALAQINLSLTEMLLCLFSVISTQENPRMSQTPRCITGIITTTTVNTSASPSSNDIILRSGAKAFFCPLLSSEDPEQHHDHHPSLSSPPSAPFLSGFLQFAFNLSRVQQSPNPLLSSSCTELAVIPAGKTGNASNYFTEN